MSNFMIFLKKEFSEIIRTKWLLVIACVFGGFSILSPLTARFMTDILVLALGDDGLGIPLPAVDFTQSYMQFFGDIGQMGIIAIILLSMGVILRELRSGTAYTMFMKGLAPAVFVIAKFTARAFALLVIMFLAATLVQLYTFLLFEETFNYGNVLLSVSLIWLYLSFVLSFVMFASAAVNSTAISALVSFGAWILLMIFGQIPVVGRFVPSILSAERPFEVLTGYFSNYLLWNILITVALILVFLALCARVIQNKEI
ncbi:MAG: ABC transporter permease [Defluviitaleaceae bacterium]|nr:ABC transporter permease [Defluviitaleaceae bacterium]